MAKFLFVFLQSLQVGRVSQLLSIWDVINFVLGHVICSSILTLYNIGNAEMETNINGAREIIYCLKIFNTEHKSLTSFRYFSALRAILYRVCWLRAIPLRVCWMDLHLWWANPKFRKVFEIVGEYSLFRERKASPQSPHYITQVSTTFDPSIMPPVTSRVNKPLPLVLWSL